MRDIRDPKELGEWILSRKAHSTQPVSVCDLAEIAEGARIPDYSRSESTVDVTKALYQKQMTERAEEGDRYARRVCKDHGWEYDVSKEEGNGQSVRERSSRSCFDKTPHDPHLWTRLGAGSFGFYACPGVTP